jgi:hypothetical protein
MGVRIGEYNNSSGWEPIGFFQLWNPRNSGVFNYPTEHGACDRTDVIHAKKFERKNREFLPEIIVVHLDSSGVMSDNMGTNWRGRKTPIFGPTVETDEDEESTDNDESLIFPLPEKKSFIENIFGAFRFKPYVEILETKRMKRKKEILRRLEKINQTLTALLDSLARL